MPIFPFKIRNYALLSRLSPRPTKPQTTPSFERISGAYISRKLPQQQSHDSVISGVKIHRFEEHPIKMKSRAPQLVDGKIILGTNDMQRSESLNMGGERRGGRLAMVNLRENDRQSSCGCDKTQTPQQYTASQNGEDSDDSELINEIATLFQEIEGMEEKKRKEILDGQVDKIDHDTKLVLRDVGAERKTNIVIFQMPEAAFSAEVGYARVGFREKCRTKWRRWFESYEKEKR